MQLSVATLLRNMAESREDAAIAREALVKREKAKVQTTLLTKHDIVLDFGESGLGMKEFCAEYNEVRKEGGDSSPS